MGPQRKLSVSRTLISILESPGEVQAPGSRFGAAFPAAQRGRGCGSGCTLGNCMCKSASYTGNYTPGLAWAAQAAQRALLPCPHVLLLGSGSSTEAERMKKSNIHPASLLVLFLRDEETNIWGKNSLCSGILQQGLL